MKKIAVIGVGYLGITTCIGFAEKGFEVTGIDIDKQKIQTLQKGMISIYEPDLVTYMQRNIQRLSFTNDMEAGIKDTNMIFVCVPTPKKENGSVNLEKVYQVIDEIIPLINKDMHIIIKSTVSVGTCDNLEQYIQNKTIYTVQIISNPEFLSQGTGLKDFLYAQRIVLGVPNKQVEKEMKALYADFDSPCIITDRKTSEMIKYVANNFLALKISFINEIANLCEKLDVDIQEVEKGIGTDNRIGKEFLTAGIGFGGSCFTKDTTALLTFARQHDISLKTVQAVIDINQNQNMMLFYKSRKYYQTLENIKIAVLGASFKPNTDDIRNAPSIVNIDKFLEEKAIVTIYDPRAKNHLLQRYTNKVQVKDTIEETLEGADICFIFTEIQEIQNIHPNVFVQKMKVPIILDGRNCFDIDKMKQFDMIYESIGRELVHGIHEDLVSIIVPVYNAAKYIGKTIQSVKNQTYVNWELIVIDDGSTDNSLEVIENQIQDIKNKVKVLSIIKNKGVANARNVGLYKSKGKYIAYLDADDIWQKEKLETQINFMKQNQYDFTYTSFAYLKEKGVKKVRKIPRKLNYRKALKNTAILTSTVMINIENIEKKLLEMPHIGSEDTATWWGILKQGYMAYGLNEILTLYRRTNTTLSANKLTSLKRTWNLYRKLQKFSIIKCIYYFLWYAWNATKRRIM